MLPSRTAFIADKFTPEYVAKLRFELDTAVQTTPDPSEKLCLDTRYGGADHSKKLCRYIFAETMFVERAARLALAKSDRDIELFIDEESKTGPYIRAKFDLHGYIVRNANGVFRSRYGSQHGFKLLDFTTEEAYFVVDQPVTKEFFAMEMDRLTELLQSTATFLILVNQLKSKLSPVPVGFFGRLASWIW